MFRNKVLTYGLRLVIGSEQLSAYPERCEWDIRVYTVPN